MIIPPSTGVVAMIIADAVVLLALFALIAHADGWRTALWVIFMTLVTIVSLVLLICGALFLAILIT